MEQSGKESAFAPKGDDAPNGGESVARARSRTSDAVETEEKAPELSEAQIEEFREAFYLFDTDGSGTISTEYVQYVMWKVLFG